MLRRAPSEVKPPQPIDRLLQDIAGGVETTHLTPGLKAFISDPLRESVGRRLKGAQGWTFVGCDPVEGRGISRLGTQVVQICYARGLGAPPNPLGTGPYRDERGPPPLDRKRTRPNSSPPGNSEA